MPASQSGHEPDHEDLVALLREAKVIIESGLSHLGVALDDEDEVSGFAMQFDAGRRPGIGGDPLASLGAGLTRNPEGFMDWGCPTSCTINNGCQGK